jgi:soluble lytic murein transglycosylase-like protein
MTRTPRTSIRVFLSPDQPERRFEDSFRIGRHKDADVCVQDGQVSRHHAEVTCEDGRWWIRDLESANGLYNEDQRVAAVPIDGAARIRLGAAGPFVYLEVERPPSNPIPPTATPTQVQVKEAINRYFGGADGLPAGERTMMVRVAFAEIRRKQKWRYTWLSVVLGLCATAAGAYVWRLHQVTATQTSTALELFYSIKSLDVDIASVEKMLTEANPKLGTAELAKSRSRRRDMEKNYDRYLETLHAYDGKMTPQHRLIMRIARIFGESELAMPPEFISEVDRYIAMWQSSGRLANAMAAAKRNGFVRVIADELLAQNLPPQFLYVALQESNFDPYVSGPPTRSGIAKGMWQFIPATALKYGLKLGPLVDFPRPDPADDRHHWELATHAAAAYLKDLYGTDAQASGLLVMSCYNWGEDRVLPLVRQMPANPKDRNFWKLLAKGKERIPKETYDYVFYIASAAVIGENPRLFGFDFENPLGYLEKRR